MKKIVILLVFVLSSCGIEYAGGTKIVIKGKVVDSDNNPIENKDTIISIMISCMIHNSFIGQNVDRRVNRTRKQRRH